MCNNAFLHSFCFRHLSSYNSTMKKSLLNQLRLTKPFIECFLTKTDIIIMTETAELSQISRYLFVCFLFVVIVCSPWYWVKLRKWSWSCKCLIWNMHWLWPPVHLNIYSWRLNEHQSFIDKFYNRTFDTHIMVVTCLTNMDTEYWPNYVSHTTTIHYNIGMRMLFICIFIYSHFVECGFGYY